MNDAPLVAEVPAVPLPHRLELGALATLFWLTLRQHVRGRRLLVLGFLYLLPLGLVLLVRSVESHYQAAEAELVILLVLIPHTLVPLTALLYATGMIQDEIEDQTLTYLLVRPLPKWGIYLTKLLATLLLVILLAGFFTMLTEAVIYWGAPEWSEQLAPMRLLKTVGLITL